MTLWSEFALPLADAASGIPTRSLWEAMWAGGPLVIPIIVCSFVLVLVTFERLFSLRRGRVAPRLFAERFLLMVGETALDRDDSLEFLDGEPYLIAGVFTAAVRKWGKPAVEVEQAVLDEGERAANSLRKYLRVINGIASVTPLFGLLGTVWGIIMALNEISGGGGMGRPEQLAAGIGTALVSTAAGLCVAIPATILYLFFVGRVDTLVTEIDRHGQDLVNLISAEAIEDRRSRPPRQTKVKKPAASRCCPPRYEPHAA